MSPSDRPGRRQSPWPTATKAIVVGHPCATMNLKLGTSDNPDATDAYRRSARAKRRAAQRRNRAAVNLIPNVMGPPTRIYARRTGWGLRWNGRFLDTAESQSPSIRVFRCSPKREACWSRWLTASTLASKLPRPKQNRRSPAGRKGVVQRIGRTGEAQECLGACEGVEIA
jgi:hypothetical protein